ncbi:MAG: alpha/beta hydrolase [Rhodobacteraceae bacterium]|nr:alpha/beta hydrolase [Paracoccaceae bacterium]
MKKIAVLPLPLAAGVPAFFVWYPPPMRLMPAPLVLQGIDRESQGFGEDLASGAGLEVFYATSRQPYGPPDDRTYTVLPDDSLHLGTAELRIGDDSTTLDQIVEWSTGAGSDERPFVHLTSLRETASIPFEGGDPAAGADWFAAIDAALAASRSRDIVIYVHGANTTVERGLGQAALLRHYSGRNAVVIGFVWPTAENFLRYLLDVRNAYGSGPQLAALISALAERTAAERIHVMTYSAGATVGSTALARLAKDDPAAARRVGEVLHAAPDADFRTFVQDAAAYAPLAGRTTAMVNLGDSALRLSQAVTRGSRAGRPDLRELGPAEADWLLGAARAGDIEVLRITPETMDAVPAGSHTFWYDDPWVSSDVLAVLLFHLSGTERGLAANVSGDGAPYLSFPPDYPGFMPTLRATIADRLR